MDATISNTLALRRQQLRMSIPALASRSGVSVATVRRILAGRAAEASYASVSAVAEALGVPLQTAPHDPEVFREQVARTKAERLMRMVQGTSALEAQAVSADAVARMVSKTVHELLAGSPRRLWSL